MYAPWKITLSGFEFTEQNWTYEVRDLKKGAFERCDTENVLEMGIKDIKELYHKDQLRSEGRWNCKSLHRRQNPLQVRVVNSHRQKYSKVDSQVKNNVVTRPNDMSHRPRVNSDPTKRYGSFLADRTTFKTTNQLFLLAPS